MLTRASSELFDGAVVQTCGAWRPRKFVKMYVVPDESERHTGTIAWFGSLSSSTASGSASVFSAAICEAFHFVIFPR